MRSEPVRVLLVEDSPDHADLISTKLRRARRIEAEITRVDLLEPGIAALGKSDFDDPFYRVQGIREGPMFSVVALSLTAAASVVLFFYAHVN